MHADQCLFINLITRKSANQVTININPMVVQRKELPNHV